MRLAEMTKTINIPDASEIFMWVAAVIFALSICTISYVALGDAWKEVKRRVTSPLVSIRHHKNTPPPKRKEE